MVCVQCAVRKIKAVCTVCMSYEPKLFM